jgi:putative phosphoserine phosphatase/1-acylglycerol-3-phosphate O-acyltransferase
MKGIADERNWPVQRFASRGTPSWIDYTRTIYATGSLVGRSPLACRSGR